MSFSNSISDQNKLVLRILQEDYALCFDNILTILKSFADINSNSSIPIITDYQIPRDVMVFQRNHAPKKSLALILFTAFSYTQNLNYCNVLVLKYDPDPIKLDQIGLKIYTKF